MEKKFMDFPLYKDLTSNGQLKVNKQSDALTESIILWATSGKNEKIRSVSSGVLTKYIGKTMDVTTINNIKSDLMIGLSREFEPSLEIVHCEVVPNYDNNTYVIELVAYSSEFNIGVNTKFTVDNNP